MGIYIHNLVRSVLVERLITITIIFANIIEVAINSLLPTMAPVTIHGNTIDPDENQYTSRDAKNTNYIYVQGHHLLDNDEKLQLQGLDAHLLAFEGDNTYLCRYPPPDLDPLRQLPFVKHANAYHKLFKTSANLGERLQHHGRAHVTIALHDGARPAHEVEALLRDINGVSNESMTAHDNHITADITPDALAQLEALDDIKMIEFKPKTGIMNDQAKILVGANQPVSSKAQGGTKRNGSGQLVTVADTGFDKGSTSDTHLAFKNRTVHLLPVGRPNAGGETTTQANQLNDTNGHGTHVAASVLGSGTCTELAGATAINGSNPASISVQGTAPAASLLLQSLLTSQGELSASDISNTLLKVAYSVPYNSRIHTNSWGAFWPWNTDTTIQNKRYGPFSYDEGSCAATDSFINQNEDMVVLFAAGNDFGKTNRVGTVQSAQIGSYAAAKNIITVGASQSTRAYANGKYSLNEKTSMRASFSSVGPTIEQRSKPDVVSPGTNIVSAKSRDSLSSKMWEGEPTVSDPNWGCLSGTSMATPIAAGCIALIRQTLLQAKAGSLSGTLSRSVSPTAALIKALVIHYASDLTTGKISTSGRCDMQLGYGRINVDLVLAAIAQRTTMTTARTDQGFEDSKPALKMNETCQITTTKATSSNSTTLKVTMVYSDIGNVNIQNSLQLSVNGTAADSNTPVKNNVQQIVATNVTAASANITVKATNIALTNGSQTFAVVWSWI